jgi:hypothetical protein
MGDLDSMGDIFGLDQTLVPSSYDITRNQPLGKLLLNALSASDTNETQQRPSSSNKKFSMNRHYYTVPSVADPHHVGVSPDPAFHLDRAPDPDSTFHSDADPDSTIQYDADPVLPLPFSPDLDPPMLQNDP